MSESNEGEATSLSLDVGFQGTERCPHISPFQNNFSLSRLSFAPNSMIKASFFWLMPNRDFVQDFLKRKHS